MTSRFRFVLVVGALALAGCDDAQFAGPIPYRDSERLVKDLSEKPKLQGVIRKALITQFGDDVRHMKVPKDSGLREDGLYLADHVRVGDKSEPVLERDPKTGKSAPIEGGYALYRKHCLHCHGVIGAGDGPTAEFLFPRPRDYRPGIFKFTSTNPVNAKPSRDDLRKTIRYGLHGTSMPGFDANLNESEIDQVIDYMTFLSIRGETERYLIDEAMNADDNDAENALSGEIVEEILAKVTSSWKDAETQVVNPSTRRVESSPESIQRGRDFYLGVNTTGPKLECVGCHGASGKGNGSAFVEPEIFNDVIFRRWPLDQAIDRSYRIGKDKASADSHGSPEIKADPAGVAKFLEDNPPVVGQLRKKRALMAEVPDKEFAEKLKADPAGVASQARMLLPDLDDPDFRAYLVAKMDLWSKSLDAWDDPLRPANLVDGTYKGGRRPIDLYWRISKGINGAKMPAHAGLLNDDQIWDVVNFVLALPLEPGLLPEALPTPSKPHTLASSE